MLFRSDIEIAVLRERRRLQVLVRGRAADGDRRRVGGRDSCPGRSREEFRRDDHDHAGQQECKKETPFHQRSLRRLGNRVITPGTEGVTAGDAPRGHPPATPGTVLLQCLDRVVGTRWIITARCREMRRDHQLVPPNAPNEEPLHHGVGRVADDAAVSLATSVPISSWSAANDAPYADGSARTTTSPLAPPTSSFGNSSHRTTVRRRRFTRFRSTEL